MLHRAGQQVRGIVLVPTLSGLDGEPLVTEVEQISGSTSFIVRLAHRLGGTVRQPDEIAGALAQDLLYLYRHAAEVTVVRQTAPTAITDQSLKACPRRGSLLAEMDWPPCRVPRHKTKPRRP